MKAKEFDEVNLKIAEKQEQYETLPAFFNPNEGSLTFCFQLTQEEIDRIYATGEIWFKQFTFGQPMNPIALSTNKEELIPEQT